MHKVKLKMSNQQLNPLFSGCSIIMLSTILHVLDANRDMSVKLLNVYSHVLKNMLGVGKVQELSLFDNLTEYEPKSESFFLF